MNREKWLRKKHKRIFPLSLYHFQRNDTVEGKICYTIDDTNLMIPNTYFDNTIISVTLEDKIFEIN